MTEHTPTPWRHADTIYVGDNGCPAIVDHLNLVICDMVDDGRDEEECRANAAFIVKAVNNHDALVRFFKWAMQEGPWEGGDLDGAAVQDKAESLGLIVSVPYDPEKHGAYNNYGCDAGDPWFEFSPQLGGRVGGSRHGD